MSIVHVGNEIERLREIYPEIPENVIGLRITLELDALTQIECTFNPINKESGKLEVSIEQAVDVKEGDFILRNRFEDSKNV